MQNIKNEAKTIAISRGMRAKAKGNPTTGMKMITRKLKVNAKPINNGLKKNPASTKTQQLVKYSKTIKKIKNDGILW